MLVLSLWSWSQCCQPTCYESYIYLHLQGILQYNRGKEMFNHHSIRIIPKLPLAYLVDIISFILKEWEVKYMLSFINITKHLR